MRRSGRHILQPLLVMALAGLLPSVHAFADQVVYFVNGKAITVKSVEKGDRLTILEIEGGGRIGVPTAQIDRIEDLQPATPQGVAVPQSPVPQAPAAPVSPAVVTGPPAVPAAQQGDASTGSVQQSAPVPARESIEGPVVSKPATGAYSRPNAQPGSHQFGARPYGTSAQPQGGLRRLGRNGSMRNRSLGFQPPLAPSERKKQDQSGSAAAQASNPPAAPPQEPPPANPPVASDDSQETEDGPPADVPDAADAPAEDAGNTPPEEH